jgi:RHS repeat-associated protein
MRLALLRGGMSLLTLAVVSCCTLVALASPAPASAEPLCTDTWTGASGGVWQTATNWSTGKVPSSTDVACVGSGGSVTVGGGANHAGVLEDKGTLGISGGSLELSNALEASSITSFVMTGGSLVGAGSLVVSASFYWEGTSTIGGSGSLTLGSGVSGGEITRSSEASESMTLEGRTLINEGKLILDGGTFYMSNGAKFENKGTFNPDDPQERAPYGSAIEPPSSEGTAPLIVNTGVFEKTDGTTTKIHVRVENSGTIEAGNGQIELTDGGSGVGGTWGGSIGTVSFGGSGASYSLDGGTLSSSIGVDGGTVSMEGLSGTAAHLYVSSGSVSLTKGSMTVSGLSLTGGSLGGAGSLVVSSSFLWEGTSTIGGTGTLTLGSGVTEGRIVRFSEASEVMTLESRTLVNEGSLNFDGGKLLMSHGAVLRNAGTMQAGSERVEPGGGAIGHGEGTAPLLVNTGTFYKGEGSGVTIVNVPFENQGIVEARLGEFRFTEPIGSEPSTQYGGAEDPSAPGQIHSTCGKPVSCATGNESESQTDFQIGGRGVGLDLTRYYNSQAAAAGEHGVFGYGWTSSFSDHLVVNKTSKVTTLHQADGSTVPFTEGTGGAFTAPVWTQDILSGTEAAGYTLTLANQTKYKFAGATGRLESVTDRDGNATTLTYNGGGQLTTITDPASRTIKLTYNGEGLVESTEDPMKHVVKYTYEGGNLKSVTQPAEAGLRWQFKYDGSHQVTELTDGRGGKTINEYNASHQVVSQKDPLEHKLTFEYEPFHTKITNVATGSVTSEYFTSSDEPSAITHGYDTASATTESFTYNTAGLPLTITDGNGHVTKYGYDSANDRTSMVDANKNETKWTYDSTHDVETMTTPKGEKTTIKPEAHGNPETISRPAPESMTQTTKYTYGTHGELESVEDPLKRVWKYGYDSKGDRTSETDPETNKRTWEYNEDSQETATISPRGNAAGAKASEFTTKIERDAQGRPLKITDPLGHTTKYTYDGDGNVETVMDGNSHTTKYTYNADNEPIEVEEPNKTTTETEYDGAGQVVSQTDGNKHTTKYVRNVLEQVTEVEDPLKHKTLKEYDLVGNLKKLTDPTKRTTTYTYDPGNRLTEVVYSSGKPSTVKYEYDKDGDRTKMTDGTGTTTYTYDQLDRQTESENGHKEVVKYEYDLANDQTKITYPNKKAVTRAFDKDGRLEKLTDWLSHSTKFTYNEDSDLKAIAFPSETKDEDTYAYNDADQMSEVKMKKSTEVLGSLVYTRDSDGQVKKITTKDLPGAEVTENTYDENNRLTKYGSTEYKYDSANNPTKEGSSTNTFNEGDELEKGTGTTYAYDELGERTKTTPEKGGATTYGYDQAGNLTSVERPEKESVPKIEDSYTYNGEGLRTSQTISGTTSYFAWDGTEGTPLILSDGTNSYIYGPDGIPVEQINGSEVPSYLHHDQQGSIRLLTGSAGTTTGSVTFDAYGNKVESTGTISPLGYDAQYTSSDTGLIYLRARAYDPTTAQFLTVDPLVGATGAPYNYTGDNPLNYGDSSGNISFSTILTLGAAAATDAACAVTVEVPGVDVATCGGAEEADSAAAADLATDAAADSTTSGTTVLGSYPEYVEMGDELGANYFNVPPDEWSAMTPEEQWAANKEFLDEAIERNDTFQLTKSPDEAEEGTFFQKEIEYLRDQGYTFEGNLAMMPEGGLSCGL